jgi:uncharacterized protein YbaP (TraB family)
MRHRLATFCLLLGLAAAGPAAALPPVWTVLDPDSELVLFGSIHLLPPDLAWRPPALDAALKRAGDLWLEVPSDPAAQAAGAALAAPLSRLPAGQTLDSRLSTEGISRLRFAAERFGLSMDHLQGMKPWMAEVMLSMAQAARAGAGAGVEQQLSADPHRPARVMALETVEQQAALFAGQAEDRQIASLEMTLRDIEQDPDGYSRLVDAWMAGDLSTLQQEALDPLQREAPDLYQRLVVDRNINWVEQLRARLAGSGRTVVVVGAGHLLGPDGLPARLRALGYDVQGP